MKHLEGRTPGIVDPSPFTRAGVNPVPRTYVRGFGALPLQGGRNIHPRAYPDPTNKKNLYAFLGRVF